MRKINLVYYDNYFYRNPYFLRQGLKKALEKNDLLHICYNPHRADWPDINELNKYPTLFIRGERDRVLDIAKHVTSFKAMIHTENVNQSVLDVQDNYNMMFTFADIDLDKYNIPTEHLLSWADTTVFKHVSDPVFTKILFYGLLKGREYILEKASDIVERVISCTDSDNYFNQINQLVADINSYESGLAPKGQEFLGMVGRVWEIMACKRLCYAYLNKETMPISSKSFKDGEHLVYYETVEELAEKYEYFSKHKEEAFKIAENGRKEIELNHSEDVRAKYLVEKIYATMGEK